ncbi:alpha/beta hydrolase [Streptomyces sp. NBC_00258]|uniref:alpha/beta hydrolase n=1 Tax=Streptomyces sp. NBC_00258 TaxID=2903642 RepID=UPI002E2E0703|nr:alpha/beta fold hydrolase [Streptomyces sp. NBC_00258]
MGIPGPVHLVFVHGLFGGAGTWDIFKKRVTADPAVKGRVTVHCFEYNSPKIRLRPDRRIAEIDDIADQLGTWLSTRCADGAPIVLATHSQGGLVVQRFLARKLANALGRELAQIKHIVMYGCPNSGSGFFLFFRKLLWFWNHPQERELRPIGNRHVQEARSRVIRSVVHARTVSETECKIPISAYGGATDNVVLAVDAKTGFTDGGVVDGDHFTIVQPANRKAQSYQVLRAAIEGVAEPPQEPLLPQESPKLVELASDEQGPYSVTLPFKEGTLHGQNRKGIVGSILSAAHAERVHVLAAPGGRGKSRMALEIAYLAREQGRRVWWVRADRLSQSMLEVARLLGIPVSITDATWRGNGSQTDLIWSYLNKLEEPWLLVFDDVDEPPQLGPGGGAVSEGTGWLRAPTALDGLVVVTSRDRREQAWGRWSRVHDVPLLDEQDSASMLMERAGRLCGTMEQARLLARQLGGIPLALVAAADYIREVAESGVSLDGSEARDFASYGEALRRRFDFPAGIRSEQTGESLGLEKVGHVYRMSLRLLAQRGLPQAVPLLKAFACLSNTPIPFRIMVGGDALARSPLFAGSTPEQRRRALSGLNTLGLVEVAPLSEKSDENLLQVLSLHPVVRGIFRDDEDVRHRRAAYYGLNVRMLLDAVRDRDPDQPGSWQTWVTVAPHSIEVTRALLHLRTGGNGTVPTGDQDLIAHALELARLTTRYLLVASLLREARELLLPIVANCESLGYHCDDREILALRHEKGRISLEYGEHREAEEELREVVAGRTAALGEKHSDTLASRHKLARAILEQNRWAEAEQVLSAVVEDERQNPERGPEHSDTLVVWHSLARAVMLQGRIREAGADLREILRIRLATGEPGTPETLHVRETLARCLREQERPVEAEREIRSALECAQRSADSHPALRLRYQLGIALLMQVRVPETLVLFRELLDDQRRVLGEGHPEVRLTSDLLNKTLKDL